MGQEGDMTRKRIHGFDYRQPNSFFVTIGTHERSDILGSIQDATVVLSPIGEVCRDCWDAIPMHQENIELDAFIVMPNHVHGILWTTLSYEGTCSEAYAKPVAGSVVTALRSYKSAVTRRAHRDFGFFERSVWQSSMWIHVIRSNERLNRIREYIRTNPVRPYR
jgi:REP element-mobilizing transposase RayT